MMTLYMHAVGPEVITYGVTSRILNVLGIRCLGFHTYGIGPRTKWCSLRDTSIQEDIVGKITIISHTLMTVMKVVTHPGDYISTNTHFNDLVN